MAIFVDIQGFQLSDTFILKEFASIGLHDDTIDHMIITPPIPWKELDPKYQSINNRHTLSWKGDVPFEGSFKKINEILEKADYICVKGLEKKKWLDNIMNYSKPVLDLHDYGCSALKKIRIPIYENHKCGYKKMRRGENVVHTNCAAKNVLNLRHWYISMLLEVDCWGESTIFSKFLSSYPEYINKFTEVKIFREDLRLFWESMELLRKDFGVEKQEQVFDDSQSPLIYLCTTRPWVTDLHQLVEKYFDKSSYADFEQLINDLFKLWDKSEKLKLRIQEKEEEGEVVDDDEIKE